MKRAPALVLVCALLVAISGSTSLRSRERQSWGGAPHAVAASGTPGVGQSPTLVRMAVTVDDLPAHGELLPGVSRADIARGVLRALRNNGVRQAWAFANGTDIGDEPELIEVPRMWLKAGYPVGNHTYSHRNINDVTVQAYIDDIERMDRLIALLSPLSPLVERRHVFRYPFLEEGSTFEKRDAVRKFLFEKQYQIAQVTIDYNDWAWNDAYTRCVMQHDQKTIGWLKARVVEEAGRSVRASNMLARLLFGRDIAHILLIHVGAFNAVMLDTILKDFRAHGVTFITLDEALTDPAYQIDPHYLYEGGRGFLEQIVESRNVDTAGDRLEPSPYTVARLNEVCKERSSADR
jgi:peptidoglycan/xylan/chitin deacetylase (PgdA/CDA1 family)